MNYICNAKLSLKKHIWSKNKDVFLIYNNVQINLEFNLKDKKQILILTISADNQDNVQKIYLTLMQYLFIALGSVPDVEYFTINNAYSFYPTYYNSAEKYKDKDSTLFDIDSNTLNADVLFRIEKINEDFPILNSLISLNSKNYEHINEEHRITLLIHCMEGYHRVVTQKDICLKDRLQEIMKDIYDYNDKFDAEIDKFYGGRDSQLFANIRNQYSHFIDKKIKNFGGDDYVFAFFILRFSFRLNIAKYLGVQVNEQYIKEYLFTLHDWIIVNKELNEPLKSIAYKIKMANNIICKS